MFSRLSSIVNVLFTHGSAPQATLVIIRRRTDQYWSKLSFIPLKGCTSYPVLGSVHNPLVYDRQRCSSWNLIIYINAAGWACKCWVLCVEDVLAFDDELGYQKTKTSVAIWQASIWTGWFSKCVQCLTICTLKSEELLVPS
jgi:hypothetical protein